MRKHIKKTTRIILKTAVVLALSATLLFFGREFISNYFLRIDMDNLAVPDKNSKVLIFAPHCDDETLGAGELIKKTLKAGGQVKVVMVTNGDGFKSAIQFDYFKLNPRPADFLKFGYDRQKETINALKTFGLSESNIIFLGYPDGGISKLWNANWDFDKPYKSQYTQSNRSIYNNSYTKDVPYTGEKLSFDIKSIILDYKPDYIVYPHPNDRHPDHWAVNAFVKYVLATTGYKPKEELLYLVHRGDWPTPMQKNINMYLVPPYKLSSTGTTWYALPMDKNDINEKGKALSCYRTQKRTTGLLFSAFERKNELLGKYPDIPIVNSSKEDSKITADGNNQVIYDPVQDTLGLNLSKGSDISAMYMEVSKDKNLHVIIEMDGNIEERTQYNLNLVVFNNNKASRLNLEYYNGSIKNHDYSRESLKDINGTKAEVNRKYLHFIIPGNVLGSYTKIYVNASTSLVNLMMDKTAWRMVTVQ